MFLWKISSKTKLEEWHFNLIGFNLTSLSKEHLGSHSSYAFNLLQYDVLVEVNKEKPVSHRYMLVKERDIVIIFSDNFIFLFATRSELTDDRL